MSYQVSVHIIISQANRTLRAGSVIDLRAKKSIHTLVDTASFRLPITCRLQKEGRLLPSEDTARVFNEGDAVEIQLGHDGDLKTEFKGFIKRVNFADPCEIECEGYSWQLRRKAPVKSWTKVKLKEVLQLLTAGTDITIHPDTPDIELAPLSIGQRGENGIGVIERIKQAADQLLVAYFINSSQLYVGPANLAQRNDKAVYKLGYNTLRDDELKYRRAEDVKVHIKYSWTDSKGKQRHGSAGTAGGLEVHYNNMGRFASAEAAKNKALTLAGFSQYEGYEGRITGFFVPYCQPGWTAKILDERYAERQGSFIAEGVSVHLHTGGDERVIEIGTQINKQI